MKPNSNSLTEWFGKYITEYRSLFFEFNQYQDLNNLDFKQDLILSPFSKSSYSKSNYISNNQTAQLFVNGQAYQTTLDFAEQICNEKKIPASMLTQLSKDDLSILKELFENGSLLQTPK